MVAAQGFIQVVWHGGRGTPDSLLVTDAVALTDELRIGQDRLVLIGLSLVLALILWVVYSRTLFGLATAAVSENPRVAASAGWRSGEHTSELQSLMRNSHAAVCFKKKKHSQDHN